MKKTNTYHVMSKLMMLFACMVLALTFFPKTVSAVLIDSSVPTVNLATQKSFTTTKNGMGEDSWTAVTLKNDSSADIKVNVKWDYSKEYFYAQFKLFKGFNASSTDIANLNTAIFQMTNQFGINQSSGSYTEEITVSKQSSLTLITKHSLGSTGDYSKKADLTINVTVPSSSGGTTGGSTGGTTGGSTGGTTGGSTGGSTGGTTGGSTGGSTTTSGDVVSLQTGNVFTLSKPATVTVSTSVKCGNLWFVRTKDGSKIVSHTNDDTKTLKLLAGSYMIETKRSFDSSTKFTVRKKDFNFGNIKVTLDKNYKTFTVEYTPAAGTLADDAKASYIEKWNFSYSSNGRNSGYIDGKVKKYSKTIPYPPSTPGWYTLKFTIRNDSFGNYMTCEKSVSIPQLPETPSYKAGYMTNVTHNSATFANLPSPSCGAYSIIQVYEKGKWKNKTVGKAWGSAKLTGLKANTTYRCRIVGKEVCSPQNILSYPSNEFKFRTGVKTKPAIKSVKISKAKVSKTPYKPATYYYDSFGHRHNVAASGGYYVTSYKITVTLKKRVSGPNGLVINGKYVKGKGKTYTIKTSTKGKKIGKTVKVSVKYANDGSYGGYSPSVTKKAKIKK